LAVGFHDGLPTIAGQNRICRAHRPDRIYMEQLAI
jgi:hypothetical protein